MQISTICKKCNNQTFTLNDGVLVCNSCGLFVSNRNKVNNINDKNKNKTMHLHNVLNRMESINVELVNSLYEELLNNLETEKVDSAFVDSTYICEFLKKKGKKNYILDMWLLNKYKNVNFRLTNLDKESIKLVFNEYIQFPCNNNSIVANHSMSYPQILHFIYKYLGISIDIKPSVTRNINEMLNKSFENFINELCEKYFTEDKNKEKETLSCLPEIKNFPNIIFDNNMFV